MKHTLIRSSVLAFFLFLATGAGASGLPPAQGAPRLPLDGPWTLKSALNFPEDGAHVSQPGYAPQGWLHAVVPGTVLTSYVQDGLLPDPYLDVNNKRSYGLIPDAGMPGSLFASPFWYRTTFRLDRRQGGTVWLHLDGINYRGEVWLNGKPVGNMAGMFKRGVFDVTAQAVSGANALAVEIFPLDSPGQPHDAGCGGDGQIGKTAATMYAAIGWDFTLVDGIRDRNVGIYRNVYVTQTGPVRVSDPFMVTKSVPTAVRADLSFQTDLINATDRPVSGTLRLGIEGVSITTQSVTLGPNETREVVLDARDHPGLTVAHPRLWWPVFQGKPALYGLDVSFVTGSGTVSDTLHTQFGIRTITQDTSFHGQNTFTVNGRRTFIQGGNWVQDAMLRATRKGYEAKLGQLAQAGVNMLRCWSASAPESDDFYDVCDKLGIMVWTESGAAAQVWGPTNVKLQLDNWADVVRRVRNHPSQAYYCGGNEGWPVAGTREVTLANDPTHGYQDSSQENGQRGCPYRFLGINTLYDYTAKDLFGSGPLGPFGGFCNETGTPILPPADVLKQFILSAKLWPTTGHPAFDEAIAYHDGGGFHQVGTLISGGCAQFGALAAPDMAGRVGLENYAFKGQILGAMQGRAFAEVWKRNKWDEANRRYDTGYMLWTVNSANPMAAARLANYSGEPNAALFYYAHGNKPVHAQFDYFYNDVTIVNDTRAPLTGLRVRAEVRNLDWRLKWSGGSPADVGSDTSRPGVLSIPAKDTPGFGAVHFVVLELRDPSGQLVDRALYWRSRQDPKYGADGPFTALNEMPMSQVRASTAVTTLAGRRIVTATVTNPTTHLAFFTRLKIVRGGSRALVQPTEYSDDYFSLLPHETKTVTLAYYPADLGGEAADLTVEGWNLHPLTLALGTSGTTPDTPSAYHAPLVPLSQDRPVTASSTDADGNVPAHVNDGNPGTRWASRLGHDPEWISIDLGTSCAITGVRLNWEAAAARDFDVQTSEDGMAWATAKSVRGSAQVGVQDFTGLHARGRYVRVCGTARVTPYGYSLYEFQVFGRRGGAAR